MIHSLCLNSGYTAETEFAPLLVHHVDGFPSVREFIKEFRQLMLDLMSMLAELESNDSGPEDALILLQRSVLDDSPYEWQEMAYE